MLNDANTKLMQEKEELLELIQTYKAEAEEKSANGGKAVSSPKEVVHV